MSANQASAQHQQQARPYSRFLLAIPFLPLLFLLLAPAIYDDVRAAAVLTQISGAEPCACDTNPVIEQEIVFPSLTPTRARIYHPVGVARPSAVVVVHGAHYLGMNEPRLRRLAFALASHGYLVLTPQVDELADYSITKKSAVVIGDAVHELVRRSGAPKVGLLGLSFAGGMSLIAASDPAVGRQLSAIIAIGAHDDLKRVLQFFYTNEARAPDGSVLHTKANEYGALIVAYDHASALFGPGDVAYARQALHALLTENWPLAQAEAAKLSAQGQARMKLLFAGDTQSMMADTERGLASVQDQLNAASPHFYVKNLHVPVMLLAGAGDNVVPPTETLWLARDLPSGVLRGMLISPDIGHVNFGGGGVMDHLRLIEWIRKMLDLLDTASAERG